VNGKHLADMAVEWLRTTHPEADIVTELSVMDYGGANIDVAAITKSHIIGVECKGSTDDTRRLDRQGIAYGLVAREMWLLPAPGKEETYARYRPNQWSMLEVHDGACRPRNTATKLGEKIKVKHGYRYDQIRDDSRYHPERPRLNYAQCPRFMCETLWRDELYTIARDYGLCKAGRATVGFLTDLICENLPVGMVHAAMVDALRSREWRKPIIRRTVNA